MANNTIGPQTSDTQRSPAGYQKPVLFIVFNRPDRARQVFEAIKRARPSRLFVAADGPRAGIPGDVALCEETRRIATAVDWDCELKTIFRNFNAGCGKGVAEAITWFFNEVDEGVILEDDCLPSPDFFPFCAELLDRYRDDYRIMQIGGVCLSHPWERDDEYSYSFSTHNYIWGWATWRRAWKLYDFAMSHYPETWEKDYHHRYYNSIHEENYFEYVFGKTFYEGKAANTWDHQWEYARMINSGLVVVPGRNLVVNTGFGPAATHTKDADPLIKSLIHESLRFPLVHPDFVMVHHEHDSTVVNRVFAPVWARLKVKVKSLLPRFLMRRMLREKVKRLALGPRPAA